MLTLTPPGESAVSKAPTIKDVAAAAGVSVATVSRALNASGPVNAETSTSVLVAARKLGFRPNLMGRNLRTTRTRTIGVMLPTIDHPVFAECLQGIESQAQRHQQVLAVSTTGYQCESEERVSERLLQQRVDGLILTVADAAQSPVLDKLDAEGIPYVLVFNQPSGTPPSVAARPFVSVDNHAASQQMVAHLLSLGHRRVHMLAGQLHQSDRSRQRFLGYQAAMSAAGLAWSPPLELPFTTSDTRAELHGLLRSANPPTALFCSNDQLAMTVLRDLRSLGVRVPEDISLAGFDGVRVGEWMSPVLTTVVQPTAEIGRVAMDLLLRLIGAEPWSGPALLAHTLRLGGSAAAAPDRTAQAAPPGFLSR